MRWSGNNWICVCWIFFMHTYTHTVIHIHRQILFSWFFLFQSYLVWVGLPKENIWNYWNRFLQAGCHSSRWANSIKTLDYNWRKSSTVLVIYWPSITDGGTLQSVCSLYIAPSSEVVQHFFSVIFLRVVCLGLTGHIGWSHQVVSLEVVILHFINFDYLQLWVGKNTVVTQW